MPSRPAQSPKIGEDLLLAVPNVSEGRRPEVVKAVGEAFTAGGKARLLDVHSDPDHHRSVFTLAGSPGTLWGALVGGVGEALRRIDVHERRAAQEVGQHPHVGAVDVVPLVYLSREMRGAACAEALVVADEIARRFGVPVLLYGELAGGRSRAQLRRGGVAELGRRLRVGELRPDFGPAEPHPKAGATLLAAREPLVAFNLELAPPASVTDARRIASAIREGGSHGLPAVRAIGVALGGQGGAGERVDRVVAQVSMNIERPLELPLRDVVEAVREHAPVAAAELVGLAPAAALEGFPADVELRRFDPGTHVIENALGF
jgi:glutamate formiminotransferase/glutamate formiminotransferase/formiminotetrahydrofolate cyclodeaminase